MQRKMLSHTGDEVSFSAFYSERCDEEGNVYDYFTYMAGDEFDLETLISKLWRAFYNTHSDAWRF